MGFIVQSISKRAGEPPYRMTKATKKAALDAAIGLVALDASGAAFGSIGLLAFGAVVWLLAPRSAWLGLTIAAIVWMSVSILFWSVRKYLR
jgi:hypothetical protein